MSLIVIELRSRIFLRGRNRALEHLDRVTADGRLVDDPGPGLRPSSEAFSALISRTAAAPSEICDELPAVITPSGLNTVLSWLSASRLVSGRMPWSAT